MYARYTVVLKSLMDNEQAKAELNTALSTYPLYEPKTDLKELIPKRSELNQRLLNAYKYREIGFETVGRFLDELKITMCEIMPYYNEMYKTIEIMAGLENPFDNVDFTETYKETTSGTSTNEATATTNGESESDSTGTNNQNMSATNSSSENGNAQNNNKNVHSGTPADSLDITADNIDSVKYADDVTWDKSNGSTSNETNGESESQSNGTNTQNTTSTNKTQTDEMGTRTTQGTTEHTFTKKGNQGVNTYAHDMIEFRTAIIDVTNQIINDDRISELFMRVF